MAFADGCLEWALERDLVLVDALLRIVGDGAAALHQNGRDADFLPVDRSLLIEGVGWCSFAIVSQLLIPWQP